MNLTLLQDRINEVRERLKEDSSDLRSLASSAIRMGNHTLGCELDSFADSLEWSENRLNQTYSDFLNNAYNETMSTFGRTLSAMVDRGDDHAS